MSDTHAPGQIEHDVACVRCGYSLRGLGDRGVCPECGAPLEASLATGGLSRSDPRYIETLRRGTTIYIALVPAYLARLAISEFTDVPDGPLAAMCSVAELVAAWMISTQDPRGPAMDPGSAGRQWLRAAAGGAAVLGVLRALLESLGLTSAGSPGLEALDLVASVLGVVIVYLAFARYASIARRLPGAPLVRDALRVKWGATVSQGAIAAAMVLLVVLRLGDPSWAAWPLVIWLTALALCGMLIFGIWGLLVAIRLGSALTRTLEDARARWDWLAKASLSPPALPLRLPS